MPVTFSLFACCLLDGAPTVDVGGTSGVSVLLVAPFHSLLAGSVVLLLTSLWSSLPIVARSCDCSCSYCLDIRTLNGFSA